MYNILFVCFFFLSNQSLICVSPQTKEKAKEKWFDHDAKWSGKATTRFGLFDREIKSNDWKTLKVWLTRHRRGRTTETESEMRTDHERETKRKDKGDEWHFDKKANDQRQMERYRAHETNDSGFRESGKRTPTNQLLSPSVFNLSFIHSFVLNERSWWSLMFAWNIAKKAFSDFEIWNGAKSVWCAFTTLQRFQISYAFSCCFNNETANNKKKDWKRKKEKIVDNYNWCIGRRRDQRTGSESIHLPIRSAKARDDVRHRFGGPARTTFTRIRHRIRIQVCGIQDDRNRKKKRSLCTGALPLP